MGYKNKIIMKLLSVTLICSVMLTSIVTTNVFANVLENENSITKAIEWLKLHQNTDGTWGNDDALFLDTSEVASYSKNNSVLIEEYQTTLSWINGVVCTNNDISARLLKFISDAEKHDNAKNILLNSQNTDGGWGIAEGYESNVCDTSIVLEALSMEQDIDPMKLQRAVLYLISNQQLDGSWSYVNNGETSISLNGQVLNSLSVFLSKTKLKSDELQTAILRAGNYLISLQNEDKNWGLDEDSIIGTLISYKAILNSVGLNPVETLDAQIHNIQNANGSWYDNSYITALAMNVLKTRIDMPYAKINSIKLLKEIDGVKTECYSYNSNDTFYIEADYENDNADVTVQYFVEMIDGSIFAINSEDIPTWNTGSNPQGEYSVIVQIKDNESGLIIESKKEMFFINPYFEVQAISIQASPKSIRVDNPCTVIAETILIINSNIDKTLTLNTKIMDGSIVLKDETQVIQSSADNYVIKSDSIIFEPDVSSEKSYTIQVEVLDGEFSCGKKEKAINVLPPLPPAKINASQSLDKDILYPTNDSVTASFNLKGVGTSEITGRSPIDLVLCIDDSGSMEWGDRDWYYETPSRIDYAKEVSKKVVDLLQEEDRGAVVEFAGHAWVQQDLTYDKELLKMRIEETPISPWNGTDIAEGIETSAAILDQNSIEGRDKAIILLSDGGSYRYWAIKTAYKAKEKGYPVYTIALGDRADKYLMSEIALITGGEYAYSPTMEELDEMMKILVGKIFNIAGENVVLESTIPENGMIVTSENISPQPFSIENNLDGSKTITWKLDSLIMQQEEVFNIEYIGENLISGTEILLTTNTKLTYEDKDNNVVSEYLPDLTIAVSKYILDSKVEADKLTYTSNEEVRVVDIEKNLTSNASTLIGKVEILDENGIVVDVVAEGVSKTWESNESQTLEFYWNTGKVLAGNYKVRITWSEGEKVISVAETDFAIVSDGVVDGIVSVDKLKYASNEEVNISDVVLNDSTNAIERDLDVRTSIRYSDNTLIWSAKSSIEELLPAQEDSLGYIWNTLQNKLGIYTVFMEVYKGGTKCFESTTSFEVVSESEGILGVSGNLDIITKNIYPSDAVKLSYEIINTGNVNLTDVTARVRIIDTSDETIIGTLVDTLNIDVSMSHSIEKEWIHKPIKTGNYMVVFDAIMSNGKEVPIGSGFISVEKPYTTDINEVVRPRVLAWAESKGNIDLAKISLEEMQVFYTIVNTREDFMAELRTGKYNLYIMLDCKLPLLADQDKELANEIASGKGIVGTMGANGDNLKNIGIFGVDFVGYTMEDIFKVELAQESIFGQLSLMGEGKTQKVIVNGGTLISTIVGKKEEMPAIISNQYGNGKSMLFTFDMGDYYGENIKALIKSIQYVTPIEEPSNGYTEYEINVYAKTNIGAKLQLSIPDSVEVIWLYPENNEWTLNLTEGEVYTFRIIVRQAVGNEQDLLKLDCYYNLEDSKLLMETIDLNIN